MKYNTMTCAAVFCTDGKKEVSGVKITINEYPEFNCYGYSDGFLYHVCEYESGRSLGSGLNKSRALSVAIKNINNAGIEKTKAMLKISIKKYGIANNELKQ